MIVGFIGLGMMGKPMVEQLLSANHKLELYDKDQTILKEFKNKNVKLVNSPYDLTLNCNVIIMMLPNSDIVKEVVFGKEGLINGLKKGTILIDMGSSIPAITQEIGKKLKEKEVSFIDAPVSGGVKGAYEGNLTIITGGKEDTIEKVIPIFKVLGKKVIRVGPLGSGHAVKSLNNMLAATTLLATSEALILGSEYGAGIKEMLNVFNHSSGRSYSTEHKFIEALKTDFAPSFPNKLMYKDIKIALNLADDLEVSLQLADHVESFWNKLIDADYGDEDYSTALKYLKNNIKDNQGVVINGN